MFFLFATKCKYMHFIFINAFCRTWHPKPPPQVPPRNLALSKVRHMDVNHLWLQEQCARKLVPLTKVDGTKNPSDLLTKHLTVAVIEKHLEFLNLEFREGRAEKAANLHELSRARRQEESIKGNKIFSFEDGRADSWASRGEEG